MADQKLTDRTETTAQPDNSDQLHIVKSGSSFRILISNFFKNFLGKDNTTVYTPTADYHPATKKYVDDNAGGGAVDSVFGRTGVVVAVSGDYEVGEVTDALASTVTGEPTGSDIIGNIVSLTQSEYDSGTKVGTTAYYITDAL